jgi:putative FmdB family regulatory protein
MPIYEYECTGCGKTFEIFQKIGDDPLKECRVCKGKLQKLISNCAFHLKGSGWYVTDYKKPVDTARNPAASGNGKKSDDTASAEAATAKPETPSTETKKESAGDTAGPAAAPGA